MHTIISGCRSKTNRTELPLTFNYIYYFVLCSLIARLFSNLLLCLCQPSPFSSVAETPPVWGFLDAMTHISFLTLPVFWLLLSLIKMSFSKDFLCPTSPDCSRQPMYENSQIIKCLNCFHRFLCCPQSQFKSSFSAFKIGGLQNNLCAQKSDCQDIISCLSLDYHSYSSALKCTLKALFYQIHLIL